MNFPLVAVNQFTPNNPGWSTVGNIDAVTPDAGGRSFLFTFGTRSLRLSVLGPQSFRLRFNPAPGAAYDSESSIAVVTRDLGLAGLQVNTNRQQPNEFQIDTGTIRIVVGLAPFAISVF